MLRRLAIIFGYFLLSCLVVLLTVGLVAYGQGYTYNFAKHKVVRTGIIIIQSIPSGLNVSLNGKPTKKKTTYRQAFEAGELTYQIEKAGYHTWNKTLRVLVGEVTTAQYVIMVPNDLKPATIVTNAGITSQAISRDHRHLAYVASGTDAGIYVSDLGATKSIRIYTPIAATVTVPAEQLLSVEWSDDASHLLILSRLNGALTARVMSATGTNVVNLTDQYRFDFTSLHFSGNDWHLLYWISPDGLRRLDLGSQSVSAVLADQVKQFQTQLDRVLYVQSTPLGQSLWSLDRSNHKQSLIAALPTSDHFSLAYTNYRGTDELAVVPSATSVGTLYTNIFGDNPVSQVIAHGVTDASFSPDGHFAAFSGSTSITTYDLEQSTVFNSVISYSFAVSQLTGVPTWYDSYHLLTQQAGRLVWVEYDGANPVDLGPSLVGLPAFSSSDTKLIYVVQTHLTQMQLSALSIHS
jgi:hypothetical protein